MTDAVILNENQMKTILENITSELDSKPQTRQGSSPCYAKTRMLELIHIHVDANRKWLQTKIQSPSKEIYTVKFPLLSSQKLKLTFHGIK